MVAATKRQSGSRLGPFLATLEVRLAELGVEQLKAALLAHADHLAPAALRYVGEAASLPRCRRPAASRFPTSMRSWTPGSPTCRRRRRHEATRRPEGAKWTHLVANMST